MVGGHNPKTESEMTHHLHSKQTRHAFGMRTHNYRKRRSHITTDPHVSGFKCANKTQSLHVQTGKDDLNQIVEENPPVLFNHQQCRLNLIPTSSSAFNYQIKFGALFIPRKLLPG